MCNLKLHAQKRLAKIDIFYIQNSLLIAVSSDARTRACTLRGKTDPYHATNATTPFLNLKNYNHYYISITQQIALHHWLAAQTTSSTRTLTH